tara:strand:- start:1957 stop:2769 length:813 start_codon:yes stop_codon:yes gene_type:complete
MNIVTKKVGCWWLVLLLMGVLWFTGLSRPVIAEPILIAAASSVKFAFEETAREFYQKNPRTTVHFIFGSSGHHFGQIKNGAPFDIFFSADTGYPEKLYLEGLAASGEEMIPYAHGRLALWTGKKSWFNPKADQIKLVLDPRIRKIAIANPRHAPYGRAAVEILKYYGLYRQAQSRLVMGENIAQTAHFVQSGAAQAGIISLSMAVANPMINNGVFWEIPVSSHQPVIQGLLLLRNGRNSEGAKAFVEFVLGCEGRKILRRFGFGDLRDLR